MKLTKKEIVPNVYLVKFPDQYLITSTLLRFQEHYESPKFHGKIFNLEEFQDWYAKKHSNEFTYYTDWVGFNFPSHVLGAFDSGAFNPLSQKEQQFLKLFQPLWLNRSSYFYIIATFDDDLDVFKHELAHAFYYLAKDYKARADAIMKKYDTSVVRDLLLKSGYAKHVIKDEIQAYGVASEGTKIGDAYSKHLKPMQKELKELFLDVYSKNS
jgi:hypothetical protein